VNEALSVDLAKRTRERNGEVQEACQLKRPSEHPFQELASGVLANEQRASVVACERERPRRPRRIEFIREGIFMFEPPEICRRLLRMDRRQHQDRACIIRPPTPVQNIFAAFPQRLEHVFGKFRHLRPLTIRVATAQHIPIAGRPEGGIDTPGGG
jgi:hypothetical protein